MLWDVDLAFQHVSEAFSVVLRESRGVLEVPRGEEFGGKLGFFLVDIQLLLPDLSVQEIREFRVLDEQVSLGFLTLPHFD